MSATELTFHKVPPTGVESPRLRADLLDTWVAVTNAGGAVGFVPPVDHAAVAPVLARALDRVGAGRDLLGIVRGSGGRALGMGILRRGGSDLTAHWRTVIRVMVHPEVQRRGGGRVLITGLHAEARALGLDHLLLTVRDGLGLDRFYATLGYAVVGRHPRAIRVAADDLRDELLLCAALH